MRNFKYLWQLQPFAHKVHLGFEPDGRPIMGEIRSNPILEHGQAMVHLEDGTLYSVPEYTAMTAGPIRNRAETVDWLRKYANERTVPYPHELAVGDIIPGNNLPTDPDYYPLDDAPDDVYRAEIDTSRVVLDVSFRPREKLFVVKTTRGTFGYAAGTPIAFPAPERISSSRKAPQEFEQYGPYVHRETKAETMFAYVKAGRYSSGVPPYSTIVGPSLRRPPGVRDRREWKLWDFVGKDHEDRHPSDSHTVKMKSQAKWREHKMMEVRTVLPPSLRPEDDKELKNERFDKFGEQDTRLDIAAEIFSGRTEIGTMFIPPWCDATVQTILDLHASGVKRIPYKELRKMFREWQGL